MFQTCSAFRGGIAREGVASLTAVASGCRVWRLTKRTTSKRSEEQLMPFQGNGTFARIYRWQNDAANGLDILADRFDAEDDGFATGLSNCITRDGQSPPTASIPWGNQNLTGVNNLTGVGFNFSGTCSVGGSFGVTGNAAITGTLSVTAGATFSAGLVGYTPNAGTTGGVRIAGNPSTGNAILQFVDSTLSNQWGYLILTSAGTFSFSGPGSFSGGLVAGTTISDGRTSPTQRAIGFRGIPIPAAITSSYTLALVDVGSCLEIGSSGSITIPPNSSVAFTPGDTIILQETAGSTRTISPGTGVTLRQTGTTNTGTRTLKAYGQAMLRRSGTTDTWFCAGDLT
jgi:hypothetical protein